MTDLFKDDSPLFQKIARVMLFLTSFSWTLSPSQDLQDYAENTAPLAKVITRMIPLAIVAFYCLSCEHRGFMKRIFRPGLLGILWYLLFGILCGFSGFSPLLCIWKAAEIFICLMWMSVSCRDIESTKHELLMMLKYIEILLWTTLVLALINPRLGFRPTPSILPWIQGYLPIINPNMLGFMSVMALIRLLFFPAKYKPIRLAVISGMLLCAQSRTSYSVTFVLLGIYIIESIRQKKLMHVFTASVFGLMAAAFALGALDTIMKVFMRGQSTEEMSSLSGRREYWEFAMQYVTWLGKGLATGTRSLIFIGADTFHKGSVNTHNSYLEALLDAGYIGAVPFLATLVINIFRQFIRTLIKPTHFNSCFLVFGICFAARGVTSSVLALFSFDFVMMMLFWSWLWVSGRPEETPSLQPRPKPKPIVYEKPLAEQEA